MPYDTSFEELSLQSHVHTERTHTLSSDNAQLREMLKQLTLVDNSLYAPAPPCSPCSTASCTRLGWCVDCSWTFRDTLRTEQTQHNTYTRVYTHALPDRRVWMTVSTLTHIERRILEGSATISISITIQILFAVIVCVLVQIFNIMKHNKVSK